MIGLLSSLFDILKFSGMGMERISEESEAGKILPIIRFSHSLDMGTHIRKTKMSVGGKTGTYTHVSSLQLKSDTGSPAACYLGSHTEMFRMTDYKAEGTSKII